MMTGCQSFPLISYLIFDEIDVKICVCTSFSRKTTKWRRLYVAKSIVVKNGKMNSILEELFIFKIIK